MSTPSGLPVPLPDADTQRFWEHTARRELAVPRCDECGRWVWQPRPACPRCHGFALTWTPVSGEGTVVSWTIVRPPVLPALEPLVPFVILLVKLADAPGVRMVGQLVDDHGNVARTDGASDGITMGAPVEVRWREQDGWTLPTWTLGS